MPSSCNWWKRCAGTLGGVICCSSGTCSGGTACSATSCPGGCCLAGKCEPGNTQTACGAGGLTCQDCSATGASCASGVCTGASCGSFNCTGCCLGGTCHTGLNDSACGIGGIACEDCSKTSTSCVSGTCKTAACGVHNCAGCCLTGVCNSGSSQTACGAGGVTCENCQAKSEFCDSSSRKCLTCGPTTCSGCCASGVCVTTTTDAQCGSGGALCSPCKSYESCSGGKCEIKSTSSWKLKAISATISQTKTWDTWAVGSYRNPDGVLAVSYVSGSACYQSGFYRCTPEESDTYSPSWNYTYPTFTWGELKGGLCLTLIDVDPGSNTTGCPPGSYDTIAACRHTITSAELQSGSIDILTCACPGDGLDYLGKLSLSISNVP